MIEAGCPWSESASRPIMTPPRAVTNGMAAVVMQPTMPQAYKSRDLSTFCENSKNRLAREVSEVVFVNARD